jgi:hypothetical protein
MAMSLMTNQLSAVSMQHLFIIGKFFDAKHQLETQRLFQTLMAEAHVDYHPSEGLCEIGSSVRGLAISEDKGRVAQTAFVNRMMDRSLQNNDSMSAAGEESDLYSRIENFQSRYCNRYDNSQELEWLCQNFSPPAERRNKDINFVQTILSENTIEADFVSDVDGDTDPPDENQDAYDVFALSANLFGHELFPTMPRLILALGDGTPLSAALQYIDLRSIAAKRSVAKTAFSSIISERVSGSEEIDFSFLKRIVYDLGVPEDEINELLGINPSYYAQRKVLTDYIYQNPIFYTELYESSANVLRKEVALKALNLMMQDDFYDRQLESEAMLAVMLDVMLEPERRQVRRDITSLEPNYE